MPMNYMYFALRYVSKQQKPILQTHLTMNAVFFFSFFLLSVTSTHLFCPKDGTLSLLTFSFPQRCSSIPKEHRPPPSPRFTRRRLAASTGGTPTPPASPNVCGAGAGSGSTATPPLSPDVLALPKAHLPSELPPLHLEEKPLKDAMPDLPAEPTRTEEEIRAYIDQLRTLGTELVKKTAHPEELRHLKIDAQRFLCNQCGIIFMHHKSEHLLKKEVSEQRIRLYFNANALRSNIRIIIPEYNFYKTLPLIKNLLEIITNPLIHIQDKRWALLNFIDQMALRFEKILKKSPQPHVLEVARCFCLAKDALVLSHQIIAQKILETGMSFAEYDVLNILEVFYDVAASQTYPLHPPINAKEYAALKKLYAPSTRIEFAKQPDDEAI